MGGEAGLHGMRCGFSLVIWGLEAGGYCSVIVE